MLHRVLSFIFLNRNNIKFMRGQPTVCLTHASYHHWWNCCVLNPWITPKHPSSIRRLFLPCLETSPDEMTPSLNSSAASYFMYSLKQEPFTNDKTGRSSVDQIKDPRHSGEWLNYFFVILMSILGMHPFMVVLSSPHEMWQKWTILNVMLTF